jgi:hypothetical protein
MTRFQVEFKTVLQDYPEIVEEFLNNLRNSNSPYKETDIDDIRWYYTWDFEYNENDEDLETSRFEMKYEDRFNYELNKVRINVTMKAGQFKRRDRVSSTVLPSQVIKIVDEVVKIMMTEEQKFFANDEVVNSIPPLDSSLYSDDMSVYSSYSSSVRSLEESIFDDDYDVDYEEDIDYDLDTILDKISEHGIDSLTKGEKDFLDNQSKSC